MGGWFGGGDGRRTMGEVVASTMQRSLDLSRSQLFFNNIFNYSGLKSFYGSVPNVAQCNFKIQLRTTGSSLNNATNKVTISQNNFSKTIQSTQLFVLKPYV